MPQDSQAKDSDFAGASAGLVDNLRQEYLADLGEEIGALNDAISAAERDDELVPEASDAFRRFAFSYKGQSHNFDLKLHNVVAHRLDDYLADLKALGQSNLRDLRTFLETISDLLDATIAADSEPAEIVRRLPAKPGLDIGDIETRDIEILLVMPPSTVARLVQRELQECGYRVNTVHSAYDAVPLIVRTKPNLVIASAVIDELSGIDLAAALTSMVETRNIPIALITSFSSRHESLKFLPDSVPIIKKGSSFGDDLTAALQYHFLL
jgi:CheY-like chemotaxis protein